jgi:acetolactate synthase-1/3 small subunit
LLSRRLFNIESIAAGYTEEPGVTRITIVVQGDEYTLGQIMKQLAKLVDVIKIVELKYNDSVARELALLKVRAACEQRTDIINLVTVFRANIIDVSKDTMIVEILGDESKINAFWAALEDYGIAEMVRTGKVALSRGGGTVKDYPG